MRRRFASVVALALLAASATFAQDATEPAEDPALAALRKDAEAATGDARADAYAKLARALETAAAADGSWWSEAASAWREAFAARPSADAKAGEGRALLAFAESLLAQQEHGSAIRAAFADAQAALAKARDLGSKDVAVRIALARCLAADGRTDAQIAELESAANDHPEDPAPRRALGFAFYNAGRPADAAAVLRPLSDAAPDDLNLSLTLAACGRAMKDEALALAMAERTIERHPNDPRGWEAVRAVYSAGGRWGEATERLAALSGKDPTNHLGAHYTGFAASSAQRWDEALVHLERAWTLNARNVAARLQAARILLQRKDDRPRVLALAHEVLALEPANVEAANLVSFVANRFADEGDHEAAVREVAALAKHRPDDPVVRSNLAVELRFAGRYEESERAYREAILLAPSDAQIHNDLALLLLVQGRDDEARAAFLAGVEADADAKDCAENLGWMARRDGRPEEALEWYRRVHATALRRGEDTSRYRRELDELRFPLPRLP